MEILKLILFFSYIFIVGIQIFIFIFYINEFMTYECINDLKIVVIDFFIFLITIPTLIVLSEVLYKWPYFYKYA